MTIPNAPNPDQCLALNFYIFPVLGMFSVNSLLIFAYSNCYWSWVIFLKNQFISDLNFHLCETFLHSLPIFILDCLCFFYFSFICISHWVDCVLRSTVISLQISSSPWWFISLPLHGVWQEAEVVLNFNVVKIIYFSFIVSTFSILLKALSQVYEDTHLYSLLKLKF